MNLQPPGENDVTPPASTTPAVRNETAYKALELYLVKDLSPAEIATSLGVPTLQVATWMANGRWVQLRRRLERVLQEDSNRRHGLLVTVERVRVAQEQLVLGELAERFAKDQLNRVAKRQADNPGQEVIRPGSLKMLISAVAEAATIRARAVGLDAKANADAAADAAEDAESRRTYVPGVRPGKVIETDALPEEEAQFRMLAEELTNALPPATPPPAPAP